MLLVIAFAGLLKPHPLFDLIANSPKRLRITPDVKAQSSNAVKNGRKRTSEGAQLISPI